MEPENDADARAEQSAREAKAIQAMKQELQLPYDVVAPVLKDSLVVSFCGFRLRYTAVLVTRVLKDSLVVCFCGFRLR